MSGGCDCAVAGFRNRPARQFVFYFNEEGGVASLVNKMSGMVIDSFSVSYAGGFPDSDERKIGIARDSFNKLIAPEQKYRLSFGALICYSGMVCDVLGDFEEMLRRKISYLTSSAVEKLLLIEGVVASK